jgi:uncharacterized protein (TIGR02466 family)
MSKPSAISASQNTVQDAGEQVAEAKRMVASRQFSRAVDCMNAAVKSQPDNLDWLRFRADILQTASRFTEARRDFERLVALSATDAEAWLELGHCYRALDQFADAERAFLRTLELAPQSVESMVSLGAMFREAESYEPAIRWLKKAVSTRPSEVRAHCVLGTALLAAGQARNGRASLEEAFSLNPYDRSTMAYLYVAYCQTGDRQAATALLDPEHLVRSYQRQSTAGSVDSLNKRLAEHIKNHPSLEFERPGNTTRGGGHTGNLLEDSPGSVSELFDWIDNQIRQYLADLPKNASHPYLAWSPEQWDIDAWGVVIQPGGYQEPHIHPAGWISGVYYVSVPGEIVSGDNNQQGCLELGTPPTPFCDNGEYPTQYIRPQAGKMNVFPSFVWHKTLPYESSEERICIAFDIRPRV